MEKKFIMTAFGKDRPGIVADVSAIIYENGCNLEDSQMGLLADEFTLILLLSCQREDVEEQLSRDCRRLEKEKGISVFVRSLEFQLTEQKNNGFRRKISVEGVDQAGIVYKVSKILADKGINIVTLKSKTKPSPESGTALYFMDIEVVLPEGLKLEEIRNELDEAARKLHVEITLD